MPSTPSLLKVTNKDILNEVIKCPETGMGYQIISAEVTPANNRSIVGIFMVINCEYFLQLPIPNKQEINSSYLTYEQLGPVVN